MIAKQWVGLVLSAVALGAGPATATAATDKGPEAPGAPAPETTPRIVQMGETVITATRTPLPAFDAPQSVSIINRDHLMEMPFERLEDILRLAAGVENHSHYGWQTGGVSSHLSMRGTGRNRILVLLDGVPLNDIYNNSIAWVAWGLIPREAIERLEVVRGPSSSLYGSEGLGGVVNIITRDPAESRQTLVRALGGSGATVAATALHSQPLPAGGLLLAAGNEDSDGFFMVDPEEDYTLKRHRDLRKAFAKLTYALGPRTGLQATGLYYSHEMGKGREFFNDELGLGQYLVRISHRGEQTHWTSSLYLNRADKTAYQDNAADNYTSLDREEMFPGNYTWGGEVQGSRPMTAATTLTAGLAYKRAAMDYEEAYMTVVRDVGATGRQTGVSPFLSLEARLLDDRLIANAGARYDRIRNSDGQGWDTGSSGLDPYDNVYGGKTWQNISPRAGVAYHPDALTVVRTSLGSGFRAPSLFELYKVHVRSGGRSLRFANPDLDPERIVTWDLGVERFVTRDLWARLAYYRSWATDYIGSRTLRQYQKSNKTYTESMLSNITEMDIHGLEGEVEWQVRPELATFARYTYNESEVTEDQEDHSLEGKVLPGDPRHKLRAGLTYRNPAYVNASLFLRLSWDEYSDALNTTSAPDDRFLDLRLSRRLTRWLTAVLEVENLTDDDGVIREGRIYYTALQLHL